MKKTGVILGAGLTGLAAGYVSGVTIYEAEDIPGGICSSYYMRPNDSHRHNKRPETDDAYRFEFGGGHWIHSGDRLLMHFISSFVVLKSYVRHSSIFLPKQKLLIPFPIQNHISYFGPKTAAQMLQEIITAAAIDRPKITMTEWLHASFGPTLCELFFDPFHEMYTASLAEKIAPVDAYKSPANLSFVIQGAFTETSPSGYNVTFTYPVEGLNVLVQRLAAKCDLRYRKRAERINITERVVHFSDGSTAPYDVLLSTLPLNRMLKITGLSVDEQPNPASSVLVVNIGAVKGPACPQTHWIYIPASKSRFHRVGIYSNVDPSFLPEPARITRDRVSIYVEKAYPEGFKPSQTEIDEVCQAISAELQEWGWMGKAEIIDPTWIDIAYAWSWPASKWKEKALRILNEHNIYQVGRFARWVNDGITDSIRDGLIGGAIIAMGFRR